MSCITCKKETILSVSGKTSDLCSVFYNGYEAGPDYVPYDLGIGGGDYIIFKLCLSCGQVQDKFPKEPPAREETEE